MWTTSLPCSENTPTLGAGIFIHQRLLSFIGHRPPAEAEADYYQQQREPLMAA
jgi:hypothetical protein